MGKCSREVCTQCGESFGSLQELLFHAEAFHASDGSGSTGRLERCPYCAKQLPDAVALVEHVEHEHRQGKACVLC